MNDPLAVLETQYTAVVAKENVIVVKAAVAHRAAYDPITASNFTMDTPGPCSSNLKFLPYKHLRGSA